MRLLMQNNRRNVGPAGPQECNVSMSPHQSSGSQVSDQTSKSLKLIGPIIDGIHIKKKKL